MASDCHYTPPISYQHAPLRQVDPPIWNACAGAAVQIPAVGSRVYYFPQGHMEHSSAPQSVISSLCHLPPVPFVPCRVLQVLFLADPDSDEVYARIRLEPLANNEFFSVNRPPISSPSDDRGVVVSFAKVLTPSDANNGGGFSVPKFCADSVFPPLDFAKDPPVQNVVITDVHGTSWTFRHIYRGTPRRHLLTTGWSKFVNNKKLISGDSVVFMRNKTTEKLFVGIRRAPKSNQAFDMSRWARQYVAMTFPGRMKAEEGGGDGGEEREGGFLTSGKGKVPPEAVSEAVVLAANNMPFEVVYYPKALSRDFVVAAEKVDEAMGVYWTAGMRIKMAMEMEDSTRMTWIQGTVSSVAVPDYGSWQRSPWKMLQVAWDEPEVLESIKRVSPWQVELMSATPSIDVAFPAAKRFRLPQNHGLMTDGDAYLSIPRNMGFGNSMIGHLNSSYLNYNTFPAGMQGARQDTSPIYSSANIVGNGTRQAFNVGHANNKLVQKAETVTTDLSMGSSQSDILSPDSSNSIPSTSPDFTGLKTRSSTPKVVITSFQLFGQTIDTDCPVESNNDGFGSKDYCADKGTKEEEGLKNPLGICISDPCMKLLDRIGVPCPTSPSVEAQTVSMTS